MLAAEMVIADICEAEPEAEAFTEPAVPEGRTFSVTLEDMEAFAEGALTVEQFKARAVIHG